jgi:hypothetical protein
LSCEPRVLGDENGRLAAIDDGALCGRCRVWRNSFPHPASLRDGQFYKLHTSSHFVFGASHRKVDSISDILLQAFSNYRQPMIPPTTPSEVGAGVFRG